jgi:hypothetical protein
LATEKKKKKAITTTGESFEWRKGKGRQGRMKRRDWNKWITV